MRKNMVFVFDCGGVLFEECAIWKEIFPRLGRPDIVDVRLLGPVSTAAIESLMNGIIKEREFWDIVELEFGQKIQDREILGKYYHSMMKEDVRLVLENLKRDGTRVVAGTNVIPPFYEENCKKDFYSVFDAMYASCLMGLSKPNPDFWKAIAHAEDVPMSSMFFTDDTPKNVEVARSLGIKAFLFKGANSLREELERVRDRN